MRTAQETQTHLARAIEAAAVLGLDASAAAAAAAALGRDPAGGQDDAARAGGAALAALGAAAGIDGPVRDLVADRSRRRAVDASVSELAALLDMDGLERGALAATRARAGRLVAGPVRPLGRLLDRRAHRDPGVVDPREHLRRWRERGDLAPLTTLISGAVGDALPEISAPLRPGYRSAVDPAEVDARLTAALDRMIAREEPEAAEAPTSAASRLFAVLIWADLLLALVLLGWTLVAAFAPGAAAGAGVAPVVPVVRLPFLGTVPAPPFYLALAVLAGVLLVVGFRRHTDRLGRRWARRLEVVARIGARTVVEGQAFNGIDRLESARLRLANAVRSASEGPPPTSGS